MANITPSKLSVAQPSMQFYQLWLSMGWVLIAIVLYFSLTASPPKVVEFAFSDKLEHFIAYGVLMGWFGQLYTSTRSQIICVVGFCLMGVVIEFAQGWSGYRFFDVADMVANSLGVLLGWWLSNRWLAGSLLRVDRTLARWLGKA